MALGMLSVVGGVLKTISGPVTQWVKGKQAIKAAKVDAEIKVITAKAEHVNRMAKTDQNAEIDWNLAQIENSGWKDEYLLILFSIPLVMCFIPGYDQYVINGFIALQGCPEWYQWSISIMVGAAYGYQKIANSFGKKGK